MSTQPRSGQPPTASRWVAGIVFGAVIVLAAVAVPLSGHLEGPDAGKWVALSVEQFGTQIDLAGWPAIGFSAALLGMVVAILAFVGMRDAAFASRRRRELVIDAAGFLIVLATAVSLITAAAILLSVIPSTMLRSLSGVDGAAQGAFDSTMLTAEAGAAMRLQSGQILIGFIAVGLLGASRRLDATLRTWETNDEEQVHAERALFEQRISDRTVRLAKIVDEAGKIRHSPVPRWSTIVSASMFAAGLTFIAAALTTLLLVGWRIINGGDASGWGGLAIGCAVAGAVHTYFVSLAYLGLRSTMVGGPERDGISARRWRANQTGMTVLALMATLFVPGTLGVLLLAGPQPYSVIGVMVIEIVLFAIPSAVLGLRTGKWSWHEVALVNMIRSLQSSIHDDTEQLRALLDDLASPTSERKPRLVFRLLGWTITRVDDAPGLR
ncbi:MFS family permease [Microbacterium natoriense]|uniref:MFS family permease n=1 Tax=Microbacterium natoriense TaxID=284570 RepID=A0AAW8EUJ2_9MICO|nr:hypothetical protein [Microbacterium natoriense]MDQ0646956.1 MFS family permease [Microbacterium natoriense]